MTSKTDTAKQLMEIATSGNRRPKERLEALDRADALRKELKVGWGKVSAMDAKGVEEMRLDIQEAIAAEERDDAEVEAEFELSPEELADQALRPKAEPTLDDYVPTFEESHPGMTPQEEHQSDFVPPTVVSDAPAATDQPSPTEAPQALTAAERGAIGVMSRDLLQTDAPYEEIALAIRARYPHAKTTARSLASVAADMRRDGIPCPPRRKSK